MEDDEKEIEFTDVLQALVVFFSELDPDHCADVRQLEIEFKDSNSVLKAPSTRFSAKKEETAHTGLGEE